MIYYDIIWIICTNTLIMKLFSAVIECIFNLESSSGMTDTLPLTVVEVSGPILIGEHPALKWTGKVRWERPFLKQVTDDGIGVEVDILMR